MTYVQIMEESDVKFDLYKKKKSEPLVYTFKDLKDHLEKNW